MIHNAKAGEGPDKRRVFGARTLGHHRAFDFPIGVEGG